jgi:CelD/BcsL family acetyltransferase involved in cellulose biosynthesis
LATHSSLSRSEQIGDTQGQPVRGSHPVRLTTLTVRDFPALSRHMAAWDRLAWEAPQQVPILLPDWVEATLRHRLHPGESWFCSFAYAGDRLVGALPVAVAPHPILGRRWPMLRTPFDDHSPCGDLVLSPDHAAAAFRALLKELARAEPHHLGLDITAVRQSSPAWSILQDEPDGYLLRPGPSWKRAFLDVRGDCDRYFAGLGKMRRTLRVGRQRLEQRGHVTVELRKGSAADASFLTEFLALEASGWKGRMGTAILNDPNLVDFYTRLVGRFAAGGRLEWHTIRLDGRLIAAQMGMRCGASLMLPKYSYDEDFAECSPGHLLIESVIKDAFSRADLLELNPMSDGSQHRLFHLIRDEYANVRLVRRNVLSVPLHATSRTLATVYREHVRPLVPLAVRQAFSAIPRRMKQAGPRESKA